MIGERDLRVSRRAAAKRLALGSFAIALLGSACQGGETRPPPTVGGKAKEAAPSPTPARATEWTIVTSEQTGGGDPFSEYGTNTQYYLLAQVVEPLAQMELQPGGTAWGVVNHLADSWSFPDNKTFLVTLKKNIKFHNGEELTADHVKFSFDGTVKVDKPGRRASDVKPLGEAEVVDKYTVRFRVPAADLAVATSLSFLLIAPLARKEMKAEEFGKKPIGTGPYRVVEWPRDGIVKLEAWDGFRLGKPFPPKLTVRHVPEPSTRVAELLAGSAHISQSIPVEAVGSIQAHPDLEVVTLKGDSPFIYVMNIYKSNPPLRDKRVRRAMNYAIDREGIVRTILGGWGTPFAGPLAPGWIGYTEDVKPYPYDPDRAKALLKEAGYADGFALTWTLTEGVYTKDIEVAQAVANQWAKVGIKVTLQPKERARLLADRNEGDFDILELYWPMSWDPSLLFTRSLETSLPDSKLAPKLGAAPQELVEARRLAKEAGTTVDLEQRAAAVAKVSRLMHDDAFWVFVHSVDQIWGVRKDTGWRPYPAHFPDLYWFDFWPMIGKQAPRDPNVPLIMK